MTIKLSELVSIIEDEDSPASQEARRKGLVAKPFGNYADPQTGQVVAQSRDGRLVPVTATDTPHREPIGVRRKEIPSDTRKKVFAWTDDRGTPLPQDIQQSLSQLKGFGSAGYSNFRYYPPDPTGHREYIASATDSKGRIKPFYTNAVEQQHAAAKFSRVERFSHDLPTLRQQLVTELKKPEPNHHALCLHLIMQTGMRPGSDSDTRATKKAFGATTLLTKHAKVNGDVVNLHFIGKNGKSLKYKIQDPILARHVERQHQRGARRLFETTSNHVNALLKGMANNDEFKVKDIRTAIGTAAAINFLAKQRPSRNDKEFQKLQKEIAKRVSAILQNTPMMALRSYIAPSVFHPYAPTVSASAKSIKPH